MTMGISSYGTASLLTSILQNNQSQMTNLTTQLSTGNISQSLSGYGVQAGTVLDLDSSIAAANAYTGTTTTVTTYLNGYTDTLGELLADANSLSGGLNGLTADSNSSSTDSSDTTIAASFAVLVSGLQTDISATLNTQVGNRYIFSGTRYDTAPAQSLSALPALTTPAPFTAIAAPNLPDYDSAAAAGTNAAAWTKATATIAPGETLSYGVSSNDPAIQQLIYAVQNAAAATTATDPDKSQYLSDAQDAVQQALAGLQALQATNAGNLSQVNDAATAQQQSITTLNNTLGGVTQADSTKVAAEITSLQTQMEASYRATSTLLSLSLVNYLSGSTVG